MYILPGIPDGRSCTLAACYPLHLTVICTYRKGKAPREKRKHGGIHHEKAFESTFQKTTISIESFYDRLRPCYDSIMQFVTRFWLPR